MTRQISWCEISVGLPSQVANAPVLRELFDVDSGS